MGDGTCSIFLDGYQHGYNESETEQKDTYLKKIVNIVRLRAGAEGPCRGVIAWPTITINARQLVECVLNVAEEVSAVTTLKVGP